MTPQEAFDIATVGVIRQGRPSRGGRMNLCMYRGPNGLKCAAGFLIPDDEYSDMLDNGTELQRITGAGTTKFVHVARAFPGLEAAEHAGLIGRLQDAHDSSAGFGDLFVREFAGRCREIACRHGLSTKTMDAALDQRGTLAP